MDNFKETKHFKFRNFNETDLDTIYKWGSNQLYHRTAGFVFLQNKSQAKQVLAKYRARPYTFAIVLKETNQTIGMIELNERGMDERSGLLQTKEFGVLVDEKFWRQGVMNEVLEAFIPYVFKTLEQTELWAGVFPDNLKSKKMLEKFGFKYRYTADYSMMGLPESFNEDYYVLTKII